MRTPLAVIGFAAILLFSSAAPAYDALSAPAISNSAASPVRTSNHQEHRMTSGTQGSGPSSGARDAADHLLKFLSGLNSAAEFTAENIGQQMGITMGPDKENGEGWSIYRSPDLGHGWSYGVQRSGARPALKPGFSFWFYHPDQTVSAAPVCALSLDRLRATLTAHGYVERTVPSEIGSILGVEFAKHDVVLVLTPRDIAFSGDTECVLSLQTSDSL